MTRAQRLKKEQKRQQKQQAWRILINDARDKNQAHPGSSTHLKSQLREKQAQTCPCFNCDKSKGCNVICHAYTLYVRDGRATTPDHLTNNPY